MIKPSFINEADWQCLIKKYSKKKLTKVIEKIKGDYPIQYLIGNIEFLDCTIDVSKSVLIPRFETELFVDKLKKLIQENDFIKGRILDLCTGSGCIAISLKKAFPLSKVDAVDKSLRALKVAYKNSKKNKTKIQLMKKDILKKVHFKKKYSIIVSNPPYVKLNEEVTPNTKYEPRIALYPGEDDIIFYKKILEFSKDIIYKKNIIAFEIGSTQSEKICKIAKSIYKDSKIIVEKDYNGYNRFVFILNNCE